VKEIPQDLFQRETPVAMATISRPKAPAICPVIPIPETISATEPRFRKSLRHRVSRKPAALAKNQCASQNGSTDHAEPIRAETSSNPSQDQQKPDNNSEVIRICLDETQAAVISAILDRHQAKTKICGVLCALTRSYRPAEGCTTVELQVLEADQRTIAALRKIARG
jgi:hypothetical protein